MIYVVSSTVGSLVRYELRTVRTFECLKNDEIVRRRYADTVHRTFARDTFIVIIDEKRVSLRIRDRMVARRRSFRRGTRILYLVPYVRI